jgi:hypothetical protein
MRTQHRLGGAARVLGASGHRPRRHAAHPWLALALALLAWTRPALAATAVPDSLAAAVSGSAQAPLAAFPPARERAWQVGFLRADRLQHMSVSFAITSALIILTRKPAVAAGTSLTLGLAKEVWDGRGSSGFDPVDLAADAAGTGLAVVLVRAGGN